MNARQMHGIWIFAVIACGFCTNVAAQGDDLNLPFTPFFNKWVMEKRVTPPDFDALPSVPDIQNPLVTMRNGRPHTVTAGEWRARRAELEELTEDYLLGHAPPAPGNVRAILDSTATKMGHEVWYVHLEFGPDHRAKLNCTLYLPNGKRPAPVFLCNSAYYMPWVKRAMEEGFALCIYNARDYFDESDAYKDLFGNYDWSSFRRRGWSASRAVDWLLTLDFIDPDNICIGGHSRSAKQALAGAAFDERISVIIASSPGGGGSLPNRYCDEYYFGESLEHTTRHFPDWVLPQSRYFVGRENKIPADFHFLYAMFAPRAVIMSTGINDHVESSWTVEQVYKITRPVYDMLGAPGNIALRYRPGKHGVDAETCDAYSEFLLTATGLADGSPAGKFPFTPFHVWDYEKWAAGHPSARDVQSMPVQAGGDPTVGPDGRKLTADRWKTRRGEIQKQIQWLLGDGPAYAPVRAEFDVGETTEDDVLYSRDWSEQTRVVRCRFDGVNGNFYYPSNDAPAGGSKLPVIIWLPAFCTSTGYSGGYRTPDLTLGFSKLGGPHQYSGEYQAGRIVYRNTVGDGPSATGFITFSFDPIGTAGRQEERRGFYTEYPDWSLMGRMVLDARHAIDTVLRNPDVDPDNVYLVGYAMGGMVATLTAALDDRVAGIATVAGFTPFRTDTDASGAGGVRRYSHLYGWMPRLGAFVGNEAKIPVDFNEILACIAPRPTIVMAPTHDWHAVHGDVVASAEAARNAFTLLGAESNLWVVSPHEWNRFTDEMQTQVVFMLNSFLP